MSERPFSPLFDEGPGASLPLRYSLYGNRLKLEGTLNRQVVEALFVYNQPSGFTLKDKRELAWNKVMEAAQLLLTLSFKGQLSFGFPHTEVDRLEAPIAGGAEPDEPSFRLDVSELEAIDSVGLALLVHLLDAAEHWIGGHYIIYPSKKVLALIKLYHLDELLALQNQGLALERSNH